MNYVPTNYSTPIITYNSLYRSTNNFHNNSSLAFSLLQARLDKLNYQKALLQNGNYRYQRKEMYNPLSYYGNQIIYSNPSPIYYPLKAPSQSSPVQPPIMELGSPLESNPLYDNECCHPYSAKDLVELICAVSQLPNPRPYTY